MSDEKFDAGEAIRTGKPVSLYITYADGRDPEYFASVIFKPIDTSSS